MNLQSAVLCWMLFISVGFPFKKNNDEKIFIENTTKINDAEISAAILQPSSQHTQQSRTVAKSNASLLYKQLLLNSCFKQLFLSVVFFEESSQQD